MEAMKRVDMIKQKRESHFVGQRFRKANAFERERDRREVQRDMALIKSPAAGLKGKSKSKSRVVVKREKEGEEAEESDEESEMEESSEDEEAMMEAN
jgi:large subunit ribosomal protein L24e